MVIVRKILSNKNGMSLAQVMIAIGLTGVLSLVLMQLSKQQAVQQKTALANSEINEILAQYLRVITKKDSCDATFAGLPKGAVLTELRYVFDATQDPFAEVNKKFRGTKITLTGMKIMTDAEYKAAHNGSDPPDLGGGKTIISFEVILTKPSGIQGGSQFKKVFDVNVYMGKGSLLSAATSSIIESDCLTNTGDGCIVNFDSGACCPTPVDCMEGSDDTGWFGMCNDPTPPSSADNVVLGCDV